jgi:hypothetical protein
VFEIGDEDVGSDDENEAKKRRRISGDKEAGEDDERQGLMHKDRDE